MATETIELLVKGGQATAGPPLGPKLGPTGINVGQVVAKINELTSSMKGMDVPVKVHLDLDAKTFEVEVGTPPTSALIKKELGIEKGSGRPNSEPVADLPIDNVIKIAQIKLGKTLAQDLKRAVKEVIGTCVSMGVLVEGMPAKEASKKVDEGVWDDLISGKTPLRDRTDYIQKRTQELQAKIKKEAPAEEKSKNVKENKIEGSKISNK